MNVKIENICSRKIATLENYVQKLIRRLLDLIKNIAYLTLRTNQINKSTIRR